MSVLYPHVGGTVTHQACNSLIYSSAFLSKADMRATEELMGKISDMEGLACPDNSILH